MAEIQLLFHCGEAWFDKSHRVVDQTKSQAALDWSRFHSLAVRHGVIPMVRTTLATASSLPNDISQQLHAGFCRRAAESLLHATELLAILDLFASEHIRALALKGPVLAVGAYGKLAYRECRDLDILMSSEDIERAAVMLAARGYQPELPVYDENWRTARRTQKHLLLTNDALHVNVELHWSLTTPEFSLPLTFEELWSRRVTVAVLGQPTATLATEDRLIHLCAHGFAHYWSSLKWICDIAQIISAKDIRWARLLEHAQRAGAVRMLLSGLGLARDVFGIELPPEITRMFSRDREAVSLTNEAKHRLLHDGEVICGSAKSLTAIRARERFRDRARLFFRLLRPCIKRKYLFHGLVKFIALIGLPLPDSIERTAHGPFPPDRWSVRASLCAPPTDGRTRTSLPS